MAGSRLEKIGTIYTRTTGLLKSGALNWEDRPLWYDVYEAFPPKEEPNFARPAPNIPLRKIFYQEDKIRALFHQNNKNIGAVNLFDQKNKTLTQRFIENYQKVEAQYAGDKDKNEQQIYQEAIDILKRERDSTKETNMDETISLSNAFQEAQAKNKDPVTPVNIRDIFKE